MDQNSTKSTDWLDGTAVVLSGLCLVHCLALPLIVVGLPFLSGFSEGHLGIGFRRHHDSRVIVAGAIGMLLLTIGGTIAHSQYGIVADRSLTVLGALTLAAAHFYNSALSRRCRNVGAISK